MTIQTLSRPHPHHPVVFEEFFELGLPESASPFLTRETRAWGIHLPLKAALLAAFLLAAAFTLSFFPSFAPLSNFLLITVYFFAGIPALIESIEDLIDLEVNIDVLMTLAAFSSVMIGSGMEGGLLLVLFSLSGSIEDAVTAKAKSSISSLRKLSPTKACVVEEDGTLLERNLNDIITGTKILVRSGQIVPLDGTVIEGISSVNLVHLTGENIPALKKISDQVPAGARTLEGVLVLKVTHTSADSTLAKIIQLVTQAQEARPVLQRWFDKLSKNYAITIILLFVLFSITLPWFLNIPFLGVEGSVYRSLAFLIAASPCALIIAIPIAYLSAISACARRGILLKGGISFDALACCSSIAFDKTGTLTSGELTCKGIESLESIDQKELAAALAIAFALEKNATHPMARSIVKYVQELKIPHAAIYNFKTIPGYGVQANSALKTHELEVFIGTPEYIQPKLSPQLQQSLNQAIKECEDQGENLCAMLLGTNVFIFRFQDTLRPKIKKIIELLKTKWRWTTVMLTGDREKSAKAIAIETGIDEYHANLKPEDKLEYVSKLASERGLAMIGDGINDAPALARATVGISMGKIGSTAAIDASDIILLHDNIELLDWLIEKAFKTQTIVRQNIFVAAAAICFASSFALGGLIPLWLAVVLHEGGTVLVGLNALRLLKN
jgi:Zn2+/Cd2+-exporting ATPase